MSNFEGGYLDAASGEWVTAKPPMDMDTMINVAAYLQQAMDLTSDLKVAEQIELAAREMKIKVLKDESHEESKAA